jgi:iron complex transport system substrate-binding protein
MPEMVAIAGGEDVAGPPGAKSPEVGWQALAELRPEVVVVMPCGWYVEEARAQAAEHWPALDALGADRVFAVDAASTYSRPGPRLVDGAELLAHLFHPDRVPAPPQIGFAPLATPAAAGPQSSRS